MMVIPTGASAAASFEVVSCAAIHHVQPCAAIHHVQPCAAIHHVQPCAAIHHVQPKGLDPRQDATRNRMELPWVSVDATPLELAGGAL